MQIPAVELTQAVYSIREDGAKWAVQLNGTDMDVSLPLEHAVTAAIRAAAVAHRKGLRAMVTIERGLIVRPLWRNGEVE